MWYEWEWHFFLCGPWMVVGLRAKSQVFFPCLISIKNLNSCSSGGAEILVQSEVFCRFRSMPIITEQSKFWLACQCAVSKDGSILKAPYFSPIVRLSSSAQLILCKGNLCACVAVALKPSVEFESKPCVLPLSCMLCSEEAQISLSVLKTSSSGGL